MISRAPFVINSFVREQGEGEQIINIQVRFSPESPQQRGGRKARKRRSERRELARTGQGASSPEATIENEGIRENMIESSTDDGCFIIDISQNDDFISEVEPDIPRQIYRPGIPQLAAFEAAYTGRPLAPEKYQRSVKIRSNMAAFEAAYTGQPLAPERHQRSVKIRPNTENYGHLFSLLKTRLFNLEEKVSNMESDRHTALEKISRLQQQERIKSSPKSLQFKRTFCRYCSRYCSQLHYCETKKIFRHEDSFLLMVLEGDTEEDLKVVAMYNNKLIMRDSEIEIAVQWIKARKDEQVHLLSKTKPTPLDASPFFFEETEGQMFLKWHESAVLGPNIPNHYLIEVAQYPGENWQSLGVIKKAPYNQIGLKNFYSLDPYLEHQFRVKVVNPHGISAASKCLITKGLHKKTRKQRIEEDKIAERKICRNCWNQSLCSLHR